MATPRTRTLLQGILLAALSVALIARCWNAGFSHYDDSAHVTDRQLNENPIALFKPVPFSTYFPVTLLSYQLDHALFAGWMPHTRLGNWAPGVRFMTLLYHIGAALFLWRMLLRLRLGSGPAFFIALVFAVHPLACETVCWISERKNALAGFFGFGALWAWLAGAGRRWRLPLALGLYTLALLSKPSALGLLPVLLLLELFGGAAGLAGDGPLCWRPGWEWTRITVRLLPLAVVSIAGLVLNLAGHAAELIPPPGGSLFTAMLTDLDVLVRYLSNLLVPFSLSAAYFVAPVRSLWDIRVPCYVLLLASLVASSVVISANRRRAVFGWLWFLAALGPSLNLIAHPHLMQDRYLYLSTPGFFLVVSEAVAGLRSRTVAAAWQAARVARVLRLAGGGYVALLVTLALLRSAAWQNMYTVFKDAVEKQPQSVFAHYGLGTAYAQLYEDNRDNPRADKFLLKRWKRLWLTEWQAGIDHCPDYPRFVCYQTMALNVGEEFNRQAGEEPDGGSRQKKLEAAEYYWQLAAAPSREAGYTRNVRALALGYLSSLRLATEGSPDEAYALAEQALAECDEPPTRLLRARAAAALAKLRREQGHAAAAQELIRQAREDVSAVPPNMEIYAGAQELLRAPIFKP
ncbi:MAG: hypothetical protein ABSE73_01865 [Planctomycetota bacterium]